MECFGYVIVIMQCVYGLLMFCCLESRICLLDCVSIEIIVDIFWCIIFFFFLHHSCIFAISRLLIDELDGFLYLRSRKICVFVPQNLIFPLHWFASTIMSWICISICLSCFIFFSCAKSYAIKEVRYGWVIIFLFPLFSGEFEGFFGNSDCAMNLLW